MKNVILTFMLLGLALIQSATSLPFIDTTTQTLSSNTNATWSPLLNMKHYRGFNVVNQSPTRYPSFKDSTDWLNAFKLIKSLPTNFNAVRLYSTIDGDGTDPLSHHLELALPIAMQADVDLPIHVGVWSGGASQTQRFILEKAALDRALNVSGCDNIIAVSVGNEDLQFHYATPALLIEQINEISAVLDNHNCCHIPVTHTDTWSAWVDPANVALVQAVDFLTVNIFPYWENTTITDAFEQFGHHMNQTVEYASGYGKEVWIGETGWPFNGSIMDSAEPSIANMQTYYSSVICPALNRFNTFIYALWDWPDTAATAKPAFGLWNVTAEKASVDMGCPADVYPFAGNLES